MNHDVTPMGSVALDSAGSCISSHSILMVTLGEC